MNKTCNSWFSTIQKELLIRTAGTKPQYHDSRGTWKGLMMNNMEILFYPLQKIGTSNYQRVERERERASGPVRGRRSLGLTRMCDASRAEPNRARAHGRSRFVRCGPTRSLVGTNPRPPPHLCLLFMVPAEFANCLTFTERKEAFPCSLKNQGEEHYNISLHWIVSKLFHSQPDWFISFQKNITIIWISNIVNPHKHCFASYFSPIKYCKFLKYIKNIW